jgi:uncharacterized protein (TIGR02302 family)
MTQAPLPKDLSSGLRRQINLTWTGMMAERLTRAFWPLWAILMVGFGAILLGAFGAMGPPVQNGTLALWSLTVLSLIWLGLRRFHMPTVVAAQNRLDETLPGRPLQALNDHMAFGLEDADSVAVWAAHQQRMADRAKSARAPAPDLRLVTVDPFALRYVALLVLALGLLFGSVGRVQSIPGLGSPDADSLAGPSWEGWIEPPAYTRLPTLYLGDQKQDSLSLPQGSRIILRLYGVEGALNLVETVSGRPIDAPAMSDTAYELSVRQSGTFSIQGTGGRSWDIMMRPDVVPLIQIDGDPALDPDGRANLPFSATDDFGVTGAAAEITLALDSIDRRYGLIPAPDKRHAIDVQLPLPLAGDRTEFSEALTEDFAQHPWANLPVQVILRAEDAAGQTGLSEPRILDLPARRFFDPMAAALIDQRQALLWARVNGPQVARILRAVSYLPEDIFPNPAHARTLRAIIDDLEAVAKDLTIEDQDRISLALWNLAAEIEDGDLEDARARMERAQKRLQEAMRNGASEQEIAELMQELRAATQDYMRQLAQEQKRQAQQSPETSQNPPPDMELSQNDLQALMDRIQELMEQGRMAEAMEALEQLREMLENMQVTEGGQQMSPGQQAMEDLADTLRDQQTLNDEAFNELQRQFNPDGGEQQQQQPNPQGQQRPGQSGRQGQQQPGQQQQGQGQQGEQQNPQSGQNGPGMLQDRLAERQRALRQELQQQQQNLPGDGTEAGDRARDSLNRAQDAMEGAEDALRDGDLPRAIERQGEAMNALREGMRDLGDAMAQQGSSDQGDRDTAQDSGSDAQRDPLGRSIGSSGRLGSDDEMVQGTDVYRRAQELLDEIRRRSGESDRPEAERDYLERLLDRF